MQSIQVRLLMKIEIQVENIKCGGCAGTIKKKLINDDRVSNVEVSVEQGMVIIDAIDDVRSDFSEALLKMGYPEVGTTEGVAATKAKAKSFMSCAVGKVGNMVNK